MTDEELLELAADKAHREARTSNAIGAVIFAVIAVGVAVLVVSDEYTHPMLPVLGIVAAVASIYLIGKTIRRWSRS